MPASSLSLEALAVRRGISVWRRFFTRVLAEPTRKAEDEIAEYLERHQHDLPKFRLNRRGNGIAGIRPVQPPSSHAPPARGQRQSSISDWEAPGRVQRGWGPVPLWEKQRASAPPLRAPAPRPPSASGDNAGGLAAREEG